MFSSEDGNEDFQPPFTFMTIMQILEMACGGVVIFWIYRVMKEVRVRYFMMFHAVVPRRGKSEGIGIQASSKHQGKRSRDYQVETPSNSFGISCRCTLCGTRNDDLPRSNEKGIL